MRKETEHGIMGSPSLHILYGSLWEVCSRSIFPCAIWVIFGSFEIGTFTHVLHGSSLRILKSDLFSRVGLPSFLYKHPFQHHHTPAA